MPHYGPPALPTPLPPPPQASLQRSELAAKAERLAQLQGEAKAAQGEAESKLAASEHHLAASRERVAALQLELEAERKRGTQVRAKRRMHIHSRHAWGDTKCGKYISRGTCKLPAGEGGGRGSSGGAAAG